MPTSNAVKAVTTKRIPNRESIEQSGDNGQQKHLEVVMYIDIWNGSQLTFHSFFDDFQLILFSS